jgi:hypothetical protein
MSSADSYIITIIFCLLGYVLRERNARNALAIDIELFEDTAKVQMTGRGSCHEPYGQMSQKFKLCPFLEFMGSHAQPITLNP